MRWTPSEVEKFIFPQSVESCQNNHSGSGLILDQFCSLRYSEPLLWITDNHPEISQQLLANYWQIAQLHIRTPPTTASLYLMHQTWIFHQWYITETSIESQPNLKLTQREHQGTVRASEGKDGGVSFPVRLIKAESCALLHPQCLLLPLPLSVLIMWKIISPVIQGQDTWTLPLWIFITTRSMMSVASWSFSTRSGTTGVIFLIVKMMVSGLKSVTMCVHIATHGSQRGQSGLFSHRFLSPLCPCDIWVTACKTVKLTKSKLFFSRFYQMKRFWITWQTDKLKIFRELQPGDWWCRCQNSYCKLSESSAFTPKIKLCNLSLWWRTATLSRHFSVPHA